MTLLLILLLLACPALILAWLLCDAWGSRPQRLTCGVFALIFGIIGTWYVTHTLDHLIHKIKFESATMALIDEVIQAVEAGKDEEVVDELKVFRSEIQTGSGNANGYPETARKAADRIKAKNPR